MASDADKMTTAIEADAASAPVIVVMEGVAWEGHISSLRRGGFTLVCRIFGTYAERIERQFEIADIDDIAVVSDTPDAPRANLEPEMDDLNRISRELIVKADQSGDPMVERALRAAQQNMMTAQLALKKGKASNGSQHHRPAPDPRASAGSSGGAAGGGSALGDPTFVARWNAPDEWVRLTGPVNATWLGQHGVAVRVGGADDGWNFYPTSEGGQTDPH